MLETISWQTFTVSFLIVKIGIDIEIEIMDFGWKFGRFLFFVSWKKLTSCSSTEIVTLIFGNQFWSIYKKLVVLSVSWNIYKSGDLWFLVSNFDSRFHLSENSRRAMCLFLGHLCVVWVGVFISWFTFTFSKIICIQLYIRFNKCSFIHTWYISKLVSD